MASPQLEHGHLRIANEVWEHLFSTDLSGSEFRLVAAVIRQSWGRRRKECEASVTDMMNLTKLSERGIGVARGALVARNILNVIAGGGRGSKSKWSFNKDWEAWKNPARPCGDKKPRTTVHGCTTVQKTPQESASFPEQLCILSGSKPLNAQGAEPRKDSFKDNIKTTVAKATGAAAEKPRRARDEAYEIFCSEFAEHRGIPYRGTTGDFVQLAELRRVVGGNGIPCGWTRAIHNYFATPQSKYTLADLSSRYDVFMQTALDRFNKPVSGVIHKDVHDKNSETLRSILEERNHEG